MNFSVQVLNDAFTEVSHSHWKRFNTLQVLVQKHEKDLKHAWILREAWGKKKLHLSSLLSCVCLKGTKDRYFWNALQWHFQEFAGEKAPVLLSMLIFWPQMGAEGYQNSCNQPNICKTMSPLIQQAFYKDLDDNEQMREKKNPNN